MASDPRLIVIVIGSDRQEALERMAQALARFRVGGIGTTLEFLRFVLAHPEFKSGRVSTALVERMIGEMGAG